MIISTVSASNCTPKTIVIGRRGTYETMQIVFDLTYLIENYGNGTAVLAIKRSQDESAYPAVVTQEDNTLTWTITETDTYYVGSGECQLMWYVDGGLAKTIIYPMVVMRDILSTTEEPPDGYENWIEHLTELGAETQQNAQDAEQSAFEAKASEDSAAESAQRAEDAAGMLVDVSATATTLEPGQPATAEYDEGVFKFGIPKGDKLTYADLTEADKEDLVQGPIKDAQDTAVEAVGTTKTNAVNAVNQAGTTQVNNVNQAGTTQVGNVQNEGRTQVQAVEDKGAEVIASIPSDYSDLTAEVDDLTRQISDETTGLDTKAPVILETASGAIASFDDGADSMPIRKIVATIEPVQSGTGDPSPDNVRPISGWTGADVWHTKYNMLDQDELLKASGWVKSTDAGFITYGDKNAQVYKGTIVAAYNKFRRGSLLPIKGAKPGKRYVIGYHWRSIDAHRENGIKMEIWYSDGTGSGVTEAQSANQKWASRIFVTPNNKVPVGIAFTYNSTYQIYMAGLMCVEYDNYNNIVGDKIIPNDLRTLPITFTDPTTGDPLTVYGGTVTLNEDGSVDLYSNVSIQTYGRRSDWGQSSAWGKTNTAVFFVSGQTAIDYYSYNNKPIVACDRFVCSSRNNIYLTDAEMVGPSGDPGAAAFTVRINKSRANSISAFNNWVEANPITMAYKSKYPRTYHFDNIGQIKSFLGQNNVWSDTGDIAELVYPADTKLFLTARDEEITESIAPIENGTTASKAYAAGDYFFHNTKFCKALTAIASEATFTLGTNYQETTVAAELLAAQN